MTHGANNLAQCDPSRTRSRTGRPRPTGCTRAQSRRPSDSRWCDSQAAARLQKWACTAQRWSSRSGTRLRGCVRGACVTLLVAQPTTQYKLDTTVACTVGCGCTRGSRTSLTRDPSEATEALAFAAGLVAQAGVGALHRVVDRVRAGCLGRERRGGRARACEQTKRECVSRIRCQETGLGRDHGVWLCVVGGKDSR